jgi:hypothetical protein
MFLAMKLGTIRTAHATELSRLVGGDSLELPTSWV